MQRRILEIVIIEDLIFRRSFLLIELELMSSEHQLIGPDPEGKKERKEGRKAGQLGIKESGRFVGSRGGGDRSVQKPGHD